MTEPSIPAETRIGHVHLKVADLERAVGFYRDTLGFDVITHGDQAAFRAKLEVHSVGAHHVEVDAVHVRGTGRMHDDLVPPVVREVREVRVG